MAINRAIAMAKMWAAARKGQTATSFIREIRKAGLGYATQAMYKDYRSVAKTISMEGALGKLRPEQRPAGKTMAEVEWQLSQEYMYKVKVKVKEKGRKEPVERYANILSNLRLTMEQLQQEVYLRWQALEKYAGETLLEIVPFTAYHRA